MRATTPAKIISVFMLTAVILIIFSMGQAKPDEPEQPKNLKVLPKNISHDELIKVMKGFTTSLGVRCTECHVGTPTSDGKMDFDFASDAKPEKTTARQMMKMVNSINKKYLKKMSNGCLCRCSRADSMHHFDIDDLLLKSAWDTPSYSITRR